MRRGWVLANEITLSFQDWGGAGRPCLLLHGVFGRTTTWEATARALKEAGWHPVGLIDGTVALQYQWVQNDLLAPASGSVAH